MTFNTFNTLKSQYCGDNIAKKYDEIRKDVTTSAHAIQMHMQYKYK